MKMKFDVEKTLTDLGLQFEDKGNRFLLCCPYHHENTPSFSIYKNSGKFVCFSCGVKGGLADLVKHVTGEQISFDNYKKAYSVCTPKKLVTGIKKDNNYETEGELLSVFDNKRVLEYCWSIGFSNEFIENFHIVYSQKFRFINNGILQPNYLYNRLIIPCIYDGKIVNYECRDFTKKSRIKVLYPRGGCVDFLFNWDSIDLEKEIYVVEGIKGLSHVWDLYSKNVVSTFGRYLKDNQKQLLLKAKHVCRIPDNDTNKIDKLTGKTVNSIGMCIGEMDSFYPYEYNIARIPNKGFDPANLNRDKMKKVIEGKQKSSTIILEDSGIFRKIKSTSKKEYRSCIKKISN